MKHLRTKPELLAAAEAGNWIAASFKAMMAAPKVEPEKPEPAAPKRAVRPWTEAEDQVVRDGIAAKKSSAAVGVELGRSAYAVATRAKVIGLAFPRYARGDRFQPHEDRALIDGLAARLSLKELMDTLPGRSKDAIQGRAWRLGIPFTCTYQRGKK